MSGGRLKRMRVDQRVAQEREPYRVREPEAVVPSLEQCESLAVALGFPILPEGLRPAFYYESLRNLHGLVQRSADGDQDATAKLAALRAMFAG